MAKAKNVEEQRELLSSAVFATLSEKGPSGLTLREVAARAGCTTGLVLHTFPDKQALLLHARDVLHQRTSARADAIEQEVDDAAEKVRAVALGALPTDEEGLADARAWIGFLSTALSDPTLAARHALHSRAFVERLVRLLRGTSSLSKSVATERATALAAAVEGTAVLAAGDPGRWPTRRQIASVGFVLGAVLSVGSADAR